MSGTWNPGLGPTTGDDTYTGTAGADNPGGALAGNDVLSGLGGNDFLIGDEGNDSIDGGADADFLDGGTGNDTLIGGIGDDNIVAGSDDDLVIWNVGDGDDYISGGSGNDTLVLEGWTAPVSGPIAPGVYGVWTVAPGNFGAQTFTTTLPGGGTSVLNVTDFEGVVCFASGTRIATARGEVAVEDLRVGDLVVTGGRGGALQPVKWLGHTTAHVARHPDRAKVAPVLVRAGALGRGVPFRDLRVSPDHALFLGGHLVPARLLVNGTTIVQELWCPAVTYWHVEVPSHTLLVSEGALTESYFDDGNRHQFDNGAIATLFQDFESERRSGVYDRQACYPVLRGGQKLDAIRARLAAVEIGKTAASRRRA